ncbi:MAG: enoyl-CoA hydratase/isomerase family protein [Gammaproteobacteria bacterium]|nr:enoyl-CoA hydratase/isomerase family protein [Gammaproteobacteria bacterium]
MTDAAREDPAELVLEERLDHVLVLSLNRPRRHHALNRALVGRLAEALQAAEADEDVRVVVLTGAGSKAFCAGADMLEVSGVEPAPSGTPTSAPSTKQPTGAAGNAYAALAAMSCPVIAAVNGYCYGGGAHLAIGSDIRLASTTATFRLPGAEYGLVVAAAALPRLVGAAKAKELIYTTRRFDAAEAHAWGLVSTVHEPDELMPAALEMAAQIAANSPAAVQASKAVIDAATLSGEAEALELDHNRKLRGSPEQSKRFRDATRRVTGR